MCCLKQAFVITLFYNAVGSVMMVWVLANILGSLTMIYSVAQIRSFLPEGDVLQNAHVMQIKSELTLFPSSTKEIKAL